MAAASKAILIAIAIATVPRAAPAQGNPAPTPDDVADRYLAARAHWQAKRYDNAIPVLADIVDNHRAHRVTPFAANILLDSYIATKRYDALEKLARSLLTDSKFVARDPGLEARLRFVVGTIERKRAEDLEKAGDYAGCAAAYVAMYRNGTYPHLAEVAYNAAWCMREDKRIGAALVMWAQLIQRFPSSVHSMKALMLSASFSEQIARYKSAARLYLKYAKKYSGEKDAAQALSNAAVLLRATGDLDGATRSLEYFIKMFRNKRRIDSAGAMLAVADIELERARPDRAIATYKRYLRTVGRSGGEHNLLRAYANLAALLWRASCRRPSQGGLCITTRRRNRQLTVSVRPRNPRLSREAEHLLARANKSSARARADEFNAPERALATAALSAARVELAARSVEQALAARGSANAAEALAKARAEHKDLLRGVLASDAVDATVRLAQLESLAGSPDQALTAYRFCADLAAKTNILSPSTRRCHAALERLAPEQFPRMREIHRASDRVGNPVSPAPIARVPASLAKPAKR